MKPPFEKEVELLIRSGHPALWVQTHEERRCLQVLALTAKALKWELWEWAVTTGWTSNGKGYEAGSASEALKVLETDLPKESICVLKDFHPYVTPDEAQIVRHLRDLMPILKRADETKVLVLLSPVLAIPVELEKEIVVVDFPMPTRSDVVQCVDLIRTSAKKPVSLPDEHLVEDSCLGMTRSEAENALALAYVTHGDFGPEAVRLLQRQKAGMIRKSGLLEFYEPDVTMMSVGGLHNLREWLKTVGNVMNRYEEAMAYGFKPEDMARGVLLVGAPGCGKTLSARASTASWGWPLMALKMSRMFGSLVGQSQERMRNALKLAEAMSPGTLFMDEVEKGMSGLESSGQTDSGTTSQVIGDFITWFEDHRSQLFVYATSNRPWLLPAEFLNRFEDVFFVDLPNQSERIEILQILMTERRQRFDGLDLDVVAAKTQGYNGRELRRIVRGAMREAFLSGGPLGTAGLLTAAGDLVPISVMMKEDIDRIRKWAEKRARPASRPEKDATGGARRLDR